MKYSNEELKKYYFGAFYFDETEDGYLQSYQYTKEQQAYFEKASDFWFERCVAGNGKSFEMTTEATEISFDYKILWKGSEDSFEAWCDGIAVQIIYVKDLKDKGTVKFTLPEGKKNVIIYLPADAIVVVKNFEINAAATPAVKGPKVLWLGDSITQGFGPLRSGHIYVNVANRLLNYDIINQGIGGYVYDKKSLLEMPGYNPEKIIVSLGTNQYGTETMTDIEEYYVRLFELYGKEKPVLCIIPLWRGDNMEGVPTLIKFCDKLKKIVAQYPNIKVVDGFKLVPHLSEYFLDNLHPNQLGAEIYGRNLVEEIRKSGF